MTGASLNWLVASPSLALAFGALGVLFLEALPTRSSESGAQPRVRRALVGVLAFGSLAFAMALAAVFFLAGVDSVLDPARAMLRMDGMASVGTVLITLSTLLALTFSGTHLTSLHVDRRGEYFALVLLAATGMCVAVAAQNLVLLFVGLELVSLPIHVLTSFDRARLRGNEAGLKHFLLGTFASALTLYGMALLYGATGHFSYAGLHESVDPTSGLAMVGVALVLVGFAWRLALAPFHQWAPDVYEGAPTSVTAFVSVAVLTTGAFVLMRFVSDALPDLGGSVRSAFWMLAFLSIAVGNLMAMLQRSIKRMLAYSGVAHSGYLMLGLVAGGAEGQAAMAYYLLAYVFMNLGVFAVVVVLAATGRDCERIDDLAELGRSHPVLAAALTLFLLALAGLPGTAGFWAKLHLFSVALGADEIGIVLVAVLGSVVSVYSYARLPAAMYMRETRLEESRPVARSGAFVVGLCAAAVLYLGFFPDATALGLGTSLLEALRAGLSF